LLAFGQCYFNFHFTVLKVHPCGNQREPALLCLANELADLLFMYQQLTRAQRRMIEDVAVLVRPDVAIQQPQLAVFDQSVGVFEVGMPSSNRFDLSPSQRHACLKFFQQEVVM